MAISFTGIGSGVQVSEIVDAIVNAERVPFQGRLNQREAQLTSDISAIGALKSGLESLKDSMSQLGDIDEYQKRIASGNDGFISISTNKDAQAGSYDVKVNNLAAQQKLASGPFADTELVGEGTLTFSSGTETFDIDVTDTMTLDDVRKAINNSTDNDSITATIITDDNGQNLILTAKETGLSNQISIVVDDIADGNNTDTSGLSRLAYVADTSSPDYATNLMQVTAAADASITIDGVITVSSETNQFENVISGVTITAKKAQQADDSNSTVSVTENNNNIAAGLNGFVASYNEFLELANNLGRAGESGGGPLSGDSLLRGVMSKLRQEFSKPVDVGNGETLSLSQLGVSIDRFGKASLDSERLEEQIDSGVERIQQFFVGNDEDGFANDLDTLLGFYTDSDGSIQTRINSKETQLESLDDERIAFERKMQSLESRLLSQYNSMDLLVANLNATSDYLQSQLDNMPGVVRKSK
jgi:flagellar hook-associated protein 2